MTRKISKRIKALELIKNIPFYLVADRGGFSRVYATKILKCEVNPSMQIIQKICIGFGISLHYFFSGIMFTEIETGL
jgi:transcriptional regulator with XRE-family HTH domain